MQRDALKKHKKAASDLEISVLASGVLGSTAATHPDIFSNNLDKKLTVEADKSQRSRHPPPGVFGVLDIELTDFIKEICGIFSIFVGFLWFY